MIVGPIHTSRVEPAFLCIEFNSYERYFKFCSIQLNRRKKIYLNNLMDLVCAVGLCSGAKPNEDYHYNDQGLVIVTKEIETGS